MSRDGDSGLALACPEKRRLDSRGSANGSGLIITAQMMLKAKTVAQFLVPASKQRTRKTLDFPTADGVFDESR
jgi:hypothetical protein